MKEQIIDFYDLLNKIGTRITIVGSLVLVFLGFGLYIFSKPIKDIADKELEKLKLNEKSMFKEAIKGYILISYSEKNKEKTSHKIVKKYFKSSIEQENLFEELLDELINENSIEVVKDSVEVYYRVKSN